MLSPSTNTKRLCSSWQQTGEPEPSAGSPSYIKNDTHCTQMCKKLKRRTLIQTNFTGSKRKKKPTMAISCRNGAPYSTRDEPLGNSRTQRNLHLPEPWSHLEHPETIADELQDQWDALYQPKSHKSKAQSNTTQYTLFFHFNMALLFCYLKNSPNFVSAE